jgi:predicted amidohydrolase
VVDAGWARIGGLICWENYMPLARFHLYAQVLAGPVREREETLIADLDLRTVATARRHMDPVGHYHRPDIFRLCVDTSPRPAVTELNR